MDQMQHHIFYCVTFIWMASTSCGLYALHMIHMHINMHIMQYMCDLHLDGVDLPSLDRSVGLGDEPTSVISLLA